MALEQLWIAFTMGSRHVPAQGPLPLEELATGVAVVPGNVFSKK